MWSISRKQKMCASSSAVSTSLRFHGPVALTVSRRRVLAAGAAAVRLNCSSPSAPSSYTRTYTHPSFPLMPSTLAL